VNFLPRLRQACQPPKKKLTPIGPEPTSFDPALPNPDEEANVALLSGMIVDDPVQDKSREGDPVTVLLVAFDAPDERARRAVAVCEVEVPDEIAGKQRRQLRAGARLVVVGRLTGAGGLWATAIVTRESTRPTGS
jgi:hypothetical protein